MFEVKCRSNPAAYLKDSRPEIFDDSGCCVSCWAVSANGRCFVRGAVGGRVIGVAEARCMRDLRPSSSHKCKLWSAVTGIRVELKGYDGQPLR